MNLTIRRQQLMIVELEASAERLDSEEARQCGLARDLREGLKEYQADYTARNKAVSGRRKARQQRRQKQAHPLGGNEVSPS